MKIIDLEYRFGRSLLAGFLSSVLMYCLNLLSYYVFHFSRRRFINWVAILVFGRRNRTAMEDVFCSIIQIGFATALLIFIACLIPRITHDNRTWKGLLIGLGGWFSIMAISHIIGIEKMLPVDFPTAVSLSTSSVIWGVSFVWLLYGLERKYDDG